MLAMLALLVVPALVAGAVLTLPRWSIRTIQRNRLWTIRDLVIEDIDERRLPAEHQSVQALVAQLDAAAEECPRISIVALYAYRLGLRKHRDTLRVMLDAYRRSKRIEGLSPAERAVFENRRRQLYGVLQTNLLFGSWAGVAFFLVAHLARIIRGPSASRRQPAPPNSIEAPRPTVWSAAQQQPSQRLDEWIRGVCLPGVASRGAARIHVPQ